MGIPKPNLGAAVPDYVAVGDKQEDIQKWRIRNNIDLSKQVRLVKLAYVWYQHPDLEQITQFLHGTYVYLPVSCADD
jgi:hypothetical protein